MTKHQEILSQPINVAVLGSGGREHALASKILESQFCENVYFIPGNPGVTQYPGRTPKLEGADLQDHRSVIQKLKKLKIDLVVVGPDDLLYAGIVDSLEDEGFLAFGPTKNAAKLEWSKSFAKHCLESLHIPTARHVLLTEKELADGSSVVKLTDELGGFPIVLKYDGLALGKGVRICNDQNEISEFLSEVFGQKKFSQKANPESGSIVVIAEQFLKGHEVSLFAICDGTDFLPLEPACDYKKLKDGNRGPNTGGMGAYSPVPWLSKIQTMKMAEAIFTPVLSQMRILKAPFKGLLYAGLMVNANQYWVLEFNARFGDPETQALLPRLKSDLLPLLYGAAFGNLMRHKEIHPLIWSELSCVNVVAASHGYPEKPDVGKPISLEGRFGFGSRDNVRLYFAGVKKPEGQDGLVTAGGRVLSVSALGLGHHEARTRAFEALEKITFEGMQFRKDIGRVGADL